MNLGLLDILTVQQAQRPDHSSAESKSSKSTAVSDSEKPFSDYLDKLKDKITDADNSTPNNAPFYDNLNYKNQNGDASLDADGVPSLETAIDSIITMATENEDGTDISSEAKQKILEQITGLLKTLKDGGVPIDDKNPLASLLALQKDDGKSLSPEIESIIQKQTGLGLSELIGMLAANGLQDKLTSIATTDLNLNTNIQPDTKPVDSTTAIIAGQIIDLAKTEAQAPEVVKSDIKSEQISNLLSGVNVKDEQKQASNSAKTDSQSVAANKTAAESSSVQSILKQALNNIDNQSSSDKNIRQDTNASDKDAAQNVLESSNDDLDSRSDRYKDDLLNKASLQDGSSAETSQDFIKFQKYIDSVSNMANNAHAARYAKAEDVMAQIKFGVSSLTASSTGNIVIQLHPKELGSVDVRMEIGSDGKTKVAIMAERTETLNLLQKDSSALKEMLQDALQTSSSNLSFSFHGGNGDEQWKQFFSGQNNASNYGNQLEDDSITSSNAYQYQAGFASNDRLDIRV